MPDVLSLDDAIGTEIDGVYVVQPTLHGDERGLCLLYTSDAADE